MNLRTTIILALLSGLPAAALAADSASGTLLKRGEYVAKTGGCSDCHAPWRPGPKGRPEPDLSRGLSGHPEDLVMPPAPKLPSGPWVSAGAATNTAFAGPWGVSYASNLTPDDETGIGKWREQDFIATMRTGRHLGVGRPIMPPMPWPAYKNLSDADLKALFAYLRNQPAVRNKVPDYQPPAK